MAAEKSGSSPRLRTSLNEVGRTGLSGSISFSGEPPNVQERVPLANELGANVEVNAQNISPETAICDEFTAPTIGKGTR